MYAKMTIKASEDSSWQPRSIKSAQKAKLTARLDRLEREHAILLAEEIKSNPNCRLMSREEELNNVIFEEKIEESEARSAMEEAMEEENYEKSRKGGTNSLPYHALR